MFDPYFIAQSKKCNFFEECVSLRFVSELFPTFLEDPYTKSVSNNVTYIIQSAHYTTYTTEPASDFLHRVIETYLSHECSPKIIDELEVVFISDLKNITKEHHLELSKSMLCRKLIRRFHESPQDFEYKWLPDSFKDL